MKYFEYDAHNLSIGNRQLDMKHKELFRIVNWMFNLIEAMDYYTLVDAFNLLENRLLAYCADEEVIAQAAGFDFTRHKLLQQNLLGVFEHTKASVWDKAESEGCIDYFMNNFIQYIKVDGKPLKMALDSQSYDFVPNYAEG